MADDVVEPVVAPVIDTKAGYDFLSDVLYAKIDVSAEDAATFNALVGKYKTGE